MIKVENLTKEFNGKTILNGISFHVQKGEVFGFLGPNGAGKTTTFRIILGLLDPTSGEALVFGKDLGSNDELRRKVGIVLENDGLYDQLSAYENLDYYARLYNVPERAPKINNLLDFVGLSDRKNDKVGKFSKGMKRKLALLRAIMHEPEILFLDEPSSGLDPEAQIMVRDLILDLSRKEGITVFINSHNLDEIQKICTRIAILQKGEIKAFDTIENLRYSSRKQVLDITLVDHENAKKASSVLLSFGYVSDCEQDGSKIKAIMKEDNSSIILKTLLNNGISVEEVQKKTSSLEEIYLDIVRRSEEKI